MKKNKFNTNNFISIIKSFETSETDEYGFISGVANKVDIVDNSKQMTTKNTFKNTVKSKPKVKVLWNHDTSNPIGVANLSINKSGDLLADMKIYKNINAGLKAYKIAKHFQNDKVPLEISIGGYVVEYRINEEKDILILDELDVREISLVAHAANQGSLVEVVKGKDFKKEDKKSKIQKKDKTVIKQKKLNEIKLKNIKKGRK